MRGDGPSPTPSLTRIRPALWWVAGGVLVVSVLRVTWLTIAEYPRYFPPDFTADFLLGRESHFRGMYAVAFYTHVTASPLALLLGLPQLSAALRRRSLRTHRLFGRVTAAIVLLLVAPSGLVMAGQAPTPLAGAGFAALALVTAACVAAGWLAAIRRRLEAHARWMQRSYALLCSAIVLRALGGVAETFAIDGAYAYAAWVSWLAPLTLLEAGRRLAERPASSR